MKLNRLKTIAAFHDLRDLPKPEHPLISLIDVTTMTKKPQKMPVSLILDFYSIALKRNFGGKMKYGQQEYDFDGGLMSFISPNQVFSIDPGNDDLRAAVADRPPTGRHRFRRVLSDAGELGRRGTRS